LIFGVLFTAVFAASARAITEDEAHAIGVDAYLYFYSPISMDLTPLWEADQSYAVATNDFHSRWHGSQCDE
jgi:hypothetical protein